MVGPRCFYRPLTDFVSTTIPRKAVEDSFYSKVEIARRLGWLRPKHRRGRRYTTGDCGRLRRSIGAGYDKRLSVHYDAAVAIVKAAGFDPIDYDL